MVSDAAAGAPVLARSKAMCLHELVLAQCARTPDRIAIRDGEDAISYGEVASRTRSLARRLRGLGVGAETPVGVLLPRSRNLPVALLGILAAGGAYVPLDPNQPDARIAFVLEDTGAPLVLTTAELAGRVAQSATRCLLLDRDEVSADASSDAPLDELSAPEHLAYVIYTSGSTGRPKGVMIEHRNAAALLEWAHREYSAAELGRVVAATSITFDLSVFEIFAPLTCGGSIDVIEDGLAFATWPHRAEATLLNTVPSIMRELLAAAALPPKLPVVNLAGEPLPKDIVEAVWRHSPGCRVYNLYGPSEDTTYSTGDVVRSDDAKPTIGRPLTGRYVRLLDENGTPVPEGDIGEIYVGGPGVTRGYWRRPDMTAAAFLPDPVSPDRGRVYRTGDYGQLLADGRILFLGRRDDQIKLRGYRIDLGEIDAVLREHSSVADVATVAFDDPHRGTLLRCALAPRHEIEIEEIRAWLGRRLPAYMVPAEWLLMEAIPKLSNGKVDRARLRALAPQRRLDDTALPETDAEIQLAALWSELLGGMRIHRDDSFVGLGGHSLLAARLSARIKARFGRAIPGPRLLRAPTLRDQAELLDSSVGEELPPIPAVERADGPAPCSFAQLRMWTLERLLPGCPRYNIPIAFVLRGALDIAALDAALRLLVRRQPVLRTIYRHLDGEVAQSVVTVVEPLLRRADVSSHAPQAARSEAIRLATAFAGTCFDLAQAPPFAALLIDMGRDEHLLVLSSHHIAADGSVNLIVDALSRAYRDVLSDPAPDATAHAPSYIAYAAWERRRSESPPAHAAALAYWTARLADPPPLPDLPADRAAGGVTTGHGGRHTCGVPAATYEKLLKLGRTHGASLFQSLLALSWAFLARLCDQEEFCVAAPVADRPHPDAQDLVGNFVNTVVLRCALAGDPSFETILDQARERTIEALEHASLPFDRVVQAIPASRRAEGMPFTNVMVSLIPDQGCVSFAGIKAEPLDIVLPTARFDLGLFFSIVGDELRLSIEYASDKFEASTVRRFAQHWMTLAAAALADPSSAMSRLPLLSEAERHTILEEWNATEHPCDTDRLVHSLFEAQARRQPTALAVQGDGPELSYRELNQRADRLAGMLAGRGLRPGARIALLCERSPHLIVAMLAVLKAGCAYVPLDPDSPPARHETILRIAEAGALITDASMQARAERLAATAGGVPCLRADLLGEADRRSRPSGLSPDDLAYIIFTSGTTGVPKGVAVRHRPVINLIEWVNATHSVGPGDRLLFVTSVAFDLSVYDVFGVLAAGGSIRIAGRSEVRDPRALAEILEREPITFWDSAPAALDQCVPYLSGRGNLSLRLVFVSGDWIPVTLPDRLRRIAPDADIVALGGATEAVVWSNFHSVRDIKSGQSSIPYGRPIQNARYYILDRHMEPVPIGVPGNLFIGGEVLADGYVGDPAQTAARFVPDPFRARPGARLYDTGDRARYWEDGTIEFLGRLDTQVKIRGFRVETGEIEAILAAQPGIRASHVSIRGERSARWLCGYVVADVADRNLATKLRSALRAQLPEYMVPEAIVVLDAFPLTANGKLDRARLPDPRRAPVEGAPEESIEMTNAESVVAEIWRTALAIADVGVDENFFDVGGNSVRLVSVHRTLETRFGQRIPIAELFRYPTIRSLADRLASRAQAPATGRGAPDHRAAEARRRLAAVKGRMTTGRRQTVGQRGRAGGHQPSSTPEDA
ncbi:MAG TPA: amino acid adenylation domain-containing protein [Beijerinckiaceae bacterium]|jgi:amino acid adenylation domain-containing protein